MPTERRIAALAFATFLALCGVSQAQKSGGTLRFYLFDSPGTMSIHEEVTIAALAPMMAVFNNLVTFDPKIPRRVAHGESRLPPPVKEQSLGDP